MFIHFQTKILSPAPAYRGMLWFFICLFALQFFLSTQHFELLHFNRGNFIICKSITLCFFNAFVNKKAKPGAFPFMILGMNFPGWRKTKQTFLLVCIRDIYLWHLLLFMSFSPALSHFLLGRWIFFMLHSVLISFTTHKNTAGVKLVVLSKLLCFTFTLKQK